MNDKIITADNMRSMNITSDMAKAMFQGMGAGADIEPVRSDFMCPKCEIPLFYPEPRRLRIRDERKFKDLCCPKCGYSDSQEFIPRPKEEIIV